MSLQFNAFLFCILVTALLTCNFIINFPYFGVREPLPQKTIEPQPEPRDVWPADYNSSLVEESLRKIGFRKGDFPQRSSMWTENVQLCIMFNLANVQPEEKAINMLISYYYPFFEDILLIFDGHPNYAFSSVPSFVDVLFCNSHMGWYQHKCIRKCIQQGTVNTRGHLYISDDMFINITKMEELPVSKVWFLRSAYIPFSLIQDPGPQGWGWMWWGPPYSNAQKMKDIIDNFPKNWLTTLKKHAGFPDNFSAIATSDIIYIPQEVVPQIIPVFDHIINREALFCEIATLLAVNVAAPNFIKLELGYLWGDRSTAQIERFSTVAHFVHPVKPSIPEHAALWIKYMEMQLNLTMQKATGTVW